MDVSGRDGDAYRVVVQDLSRRSDVSVMEFEQGVDHLDLSWSPMEERGLICVPDSVYLLRLDGWSGLTDAGLETLAGRVTIPTPICYLSVADCPGITLEGLAKFSTLIGFDISGCRQFADVDWGKFPGRGGKGFTLVAKGVAMTPKTIESLGSRAGRLNLSGTFGLTGDHLAAVQANHLELRDLRIPPEALKRLSSCVKLVALSRTPVDLAAVPETATSVQLDGDPGIRGAHLKRLHSALTALNLSDNPHLKPEDFECVPGGLETLSLYNCPQVTRAHLEALPKGITTLGVGGCFQLTTDDLEAVLRGRKMKVLNVSGCPNVSGERIKELFPHAAVFS